MKKVIVSGANGFVGTALCRLLSERGVEVIAILRDPSEYADDIKDLPGLRIVYCDLSSFIDLANLIEDRDADAFYHFAWVGTAGPLRGDDTVQLNNVRYTLDAVKVCAKMGCRRFVFASSIMEYEIDMVMKTDVSPGINTLYSSAKIAADYMARTICAKYGIDFIRAVISNIYGPGERSPRLVNTSLRKMLSGEHCAFSSGTQMYDFIFIDDAVETFFAIAEKGVADRTYYIGSQQPKPLREFLLEMRDQVDPSIEIGLGEIPFGGVSLTYEEFDINAVKVDTGFVPKVDFAEGIQRTIGWMQEQKEAP